MMRCTFSSNQALNYKSISMIQMKYSTTEISWFHGLKMMVKELICLYSNLFLDENNVKC